ncbi:2-oxo acid dehydrogenase subunit E2 [Actinocorallia sp. API 0066]|uniref:2-oxo acid dehydrogenase subunit E2 n=1 Tax=Actinocorallia sp. API 0066 TaxID=2896846 RepID=UPI001E37BBF1|nr:2-oxo acid dehydrogenase subunit E2 [Actinocorallia sp. API 0066]MCD0451592.1 2-oxo acid dehydrogenase subunit E2 [Actinocorallia sp. API 0066]
MSAPFDDRRRHTLFFLDQIRDFSPVFLDTEVDATALVADRAAAKARGERRSVVSYIVHAAAKALAAHPDANAAIRGRLEPVVARYDTVAAKVTLDKTLDGRRVVLATVVPGLEKADLAQIQAHLDRAVAADPDTAEEFAGIRALRALPSAEALARFREAADRLELRPAVTGTFSVTSLGHRAVDGLHSVGGTTVTFGVGRIADRPVARDGAVVVAPVLRLSLAFDHRVIDGAEAADILTETKDALEGDPG